MYGPCVPDVCSGCGRPPSPLSSEDERARSTEPWCHDCWRRTCGGRFCGEQPNGVFCRRRRGHGGTHAVSGLDALELDRREAG